MSYEVVLVQLDAGEVGDPLSFFKFLKAVIEIF